jgi:hypothetical protein
MKNKNVVFLLLVLALSLSALAHAESSGEGVQKYAWRIVNFVSAMSAIVIAGGLAWCMTDLETHGRKAKGLLFGLIGLGCIYGLVSMVAGVADEEQTGVSGFSEAAKFKP